MSKKRVSQMTDHEIQELYHSLFRGIFEIIVETKHRTCFDCGKLLEPNTTVLMCDAHGFLQFCMDCSWHRIRIKETWRKIFHRKRS